jgi:hypothetical protein
MKKLPGEVSLLFQLLGGLVGLYVLGGVAIFFADTHYGGSWAARLPSGVLGFLVAIYGPAFDWLVNNGFLS